MSIKNDPLIIEWIEDRFKKGKKIAAICAAPMVLHAAGITDDGAHLAAQGGLTVVGFWSCGPVS